VGIGDVRTDDPDRPGAERSQWQAGEATHEARSIGCAGKAKPMAIWVDTADALTCNRREKAKPMGIWVDSAAAPRISLVPGKAKPMAGWEE